tara:strand:- start:298 stop:606 length:309 start_codon:yes stop_codon:yes gene_type:complete
MIIARNRSCCLYSAKLFLGIEHFILFSVAGRGSTVEYLLMFGIGMLQLKWARFGLHGVYDKAILGWYATSSFAFGLAYLREGVYVPLVPIWLIPALTALSQL